MENCLITKLKGAVNNDNLLPFGLISVKVLGNFETTDGLSMVIGATEELEIILKDFTISGLSRIVVSAGSSYTANTSSFVLTGDNPSMLIPKYAHYNTLSLPMCEFNTDDFKYLKSSHGFVFDGFNNVVAGDMANMLKMFEDTIEEPTGLYFVMNVLNTNPSFEGCDLSALFNRKVKKVGLMRVKGVRGNIDNIGKSVDVLASFISPNDKNVSLNIENMVAIARNNGFTTGTMHFQYLGYITTTFNGAELDKSTSQDDITWDATTITVRGVTIEA